MEWFEWFAIVGGALSMIGAVWLEIRHRNGMDERVAVLESQIDGLPGAVGTLAERIANLEGAKVYYRDPPPEHDDKRCPSCGRFKRRD